MQFLIWKRLHSSEFSKARFHSIQQFYMIQPMHFFAENIQIETVFLALFNLNQYDINGE
jgi:hypothetical protein